MPSEGEGQGIAEASGLAGWIAPQTLRHDFTPARPAKQRQRQAPRQPSPRRALPLWKPPPWHPPPLSELPKGEGSLGAIYPERLRGEDAARGRPSPRPSGHGACKPLHLLRSRLPPKGAPRIERQKERSTTNGKDELTVVVGFTPSLRYGVKPVYSSVTRRASAAHVARPRTRPPVRVRDCFALLRRLSRVPIRPNRAPRD